MSLAGWQKKAGKLDGGLVLDEVTLELARRSVAAGGEAVSTYAIADAIARPISVVQEALDALTSAGLIESVSDQPPIVRMAL